jgi:hypothetical protein
MSEASATHDVGGAGWQLSRLMDGFMTTQMIYVAAKLGIAELLHEAPRTGQNLAAEVGAQSEPLTRVLRDLAAVGVFAELDDGRFTLTELGDALRYMGGVAIARAEIYFHSAERLLDAVLHGGVPFELAHDVEFFEYLHAHRDHEQVFQSAMSARSTNEARALVDVYDFTRFERIVDVGGGQGVLLTTILEAAREATGVLFDRESVIAETRSQLSDSTVGSRLDLVGGDFFDHVPRGGDAYVLSRVLHDWDDETAVRILQTCRAAMDPHARLLVAETVLPRIAKENPGAIRMDVLMLLLLRSRERTENEFTALFDASGFEQTLVVSTGSAGGLSLIEARPI